MADQKRRLTVLPGEADFSGGGPVGSLPAAFGEIDISTVRQTVQDLEKNKELTLAFEMSSHTLLEREQKAEGLKPEAIQTEKSEKPREKSGDIERLPIGRNCWKGKKPSTSPNQDNFGLVVARDREGNVKWAVYAVFDGHGPKGHLVADHASFFLLNMFLQEKAKDEAGCLEIQELLEKCFTATQKHVDGWSATLDPPKFKREMINHRESHGAETSGTTCTFCYHDCDQETLTIAHVGDSRCILWNDSETAKGDGKEIRTTEDHKPDLPKEKERIEAKGGRVVFDGYYNHRVFSPNGTYPGLNMSRAFGDLVAHREAGLTADPDVRTYQLKGQETGWNLLLCTDGVWEFIENAAARKFVEDVSRQGRPPQAAMETLAREAFDKWMEDSDGELTDDISGILVKLSSTGFPGKRL